jgi:Mrp family chromosome partitioning ATPase
MTEQSKIPLPSSDLAKTEPAKPEPAKSELAKREAGGSLFERADSAFGSFSGLAAAPVPAKLAQPSNRRVSNPPRKAAPAALPELAVEAASPVASPVAAVPAAAESAPREPAAVAVAPPEPPLERIVFSGAPQAIDPARLQAQGLIVPAGPVTALLEEFRIVKRQILLSAREASAAGRGPAAQRVLVCSPLPGEGKTFCATNLALAMAAERDGEVLLVDADFAKPSIPSLLGLRAGKGLMDALADPRLPVEDCVIATDIPGLYVLPAGNRTASDSEYLSSQHTAEVLDRLTRGAPNRMVIFDSPPALAASPAAELAPYTGQALVICRADQTGERSLEDALSLLSACADIKLLLNSAHFSPSGRKFGAYYGYGESAQ